MNSASEQPAEDPTDRNPSGSGHGSGGSGGHGMDPLDRDLLISRVIDGTASDSDWSAMDLIARTDSAIWRDLAQAQRCNADLTHAVHAAIAGAERVSLVDSTPVLRLGDAEPTSFDIQRHAQSRFNSLARWTGWAAAATLALAWISGSRTGNPGVVAKDPSASQQAGVGTNLLPDSASELLAEYLRRGQASGDVVAEVPSKMMLEAIPMDDKAGGYEVYYVRQIVERTRVPNLYTFSEGEGGQLQPVKARFSAPRRSGSY